MDNETPMDKYTRFAGDYNRGAAKDSQQIGAAGFKEMCMAHKIQATNIIQARELKVNEQICKAPGSQPGAI